MTDGRPMVTRIISVCPGLFDGLPRISLASHVATPGDVLLSSLQGYPAQNEVGWDQPLCSEQPNINSASTGSASWVALS